MASTIALVADSLSVFVSVKVWECLHCGKRWATDIATGCPYCKREELNALNEPTPLEMFN